MATTFPRFPVDDNIDNVIRVLQTNFSALTMDHKLEYLRLLIDYRRSLCYQPFTPYNPWPADTDKPAGS